MTSTLTTAKVVRVKVEEGKTGLFYATSPDLKGLLVAEPYSRRPLRMRYSLTADGRGLAGALGPALVWAACKRRSSWMFVLR